MVFSSLAFLQFFFPAVTVAHSVTRGRLRNGLLLLASLAFYAVGSGRFTLVLIGTSLVDHLLVRRMAVAEGRSRAWLRNASVTLNVGLLAWFKYAGWLSRIVSDVAATLELTSTSTLEIALPIGISFFTFQRLSYTIDVHRRQVEPLERAADHLLYVALFPQLIAGPIVRYAEIRRELHDRTVTTSDVAIGLGRFVHGLAKKILVADQVAPLADAVFTTTGPMSMGQAWLGALAYAVQIYFDFSGYSDMAIGLGRMLGFTFPENFARPYSSISVTDFWRRWHITLSRWFRDYVYIRLGGSRCGEAATYRNLWIVFLLTGAWHGAAWTFVLWGAYHGALLSLERVTGLRSLPDDRAVATRRASTFVLVVVGWVLFRADTLAQAAHILQAMVGFDGVASEAIAFETSRIALAALAFGLASVVLPGDWVAGKRLSLPTQRPAVVRLAATAVFLPVCLLVAAAGTFSPFLYFRF